MTRLRTIASRADAIQLGVDVREAMDWMEGTERACEAGECALSLETLVSECANHLAVLETVVSVAAFDERTRGLSRVAVRFRNWLGRWMAAVNEVARCGLDPATVTHYDWHHHIELPHVFVKARKFFDIVERMTQDQVLRHVSKYIITGTRHIQAVEACKGSWPLSRRAMITRRVARWMERIATFVVFEKGQIAKTIMEEVGSNPQDETMARTKINAAMEDMELAGEGLEALRALNKKIISEMKESQLKKRTCSMCGFTSPNCFDSMLHCGGCRHPSVARADRPRYCSEACQRAHWLAGHKDECPCGHSG